MAERPTRRPRFGYDAPSGRMLEPLAGVASAGFAPGQRPPAEWINYLLHFTTAWCDYLAGPGWGAWGRTAHGGSAPVFTAVAGLAVDADDTRATKARYRYILAGTKAGPTPILAVSRTGREWIERAAPSAMTVMSGCAVVGDRVLCWGTATGPTFKLWYTDPDTPSVASAISVDDDTHWVEATDLASYAVKGLAWNGAGEAWAVVDSTPTLITLARSTDDGETWPYVVGFSTGVTSGAINTDIAWDEPRGRYVVATDEGDIVAWSPTALVGTALDTLSGIATTANVRLRAGGGTCLAWASVDRAGSALGASLLWRSDDGGETWAAVTLPTAIGATLTDVAYADGVWVATTTAAPYLWRSDDGGATWERVQLPLDESSSWALHRAVYADGAVTATGLTWTVQTARATGLAPDSSRVYSPEPGYLADAGYLRGRRIAATAPTDGQVLVWDATGGVWTPDSSSSGPALSSATPQPLGTATAGVSTEASRADHVHTLPTIPALASTTPAALGVAAVGVGTTAARADHVHALPTIPALSSATPQPIGTATAGVSTDASASDHAHPHPATTLGTSITAGTSAVAYVDVSGTPPAAPTLAPGQTMVALIYPISAPSGVVILAQHADGINEVTRGWHLRAGDNAGSRGELHLFLVGLNGGGTVALTGADFTASTGAPHVLAVAILGDQTVRWSWDGGTVQSRAALSGTYVPPASGDPMRIGVSTLSNAPATTIQPVAMRWYSTVLSDADLVAVAADRTSYRLADPSAGTLVCAFDARRTRGVQTYPDPVNASIRWRVVGSLERHER